MRGLMLFLVLAAAPPARAQSVFEWRARLHDELATSGAPRDWRARNLLAASAEGSWELDDSLKLGGAFHAQADGDDWSLHVREAYGRVALSSFADVEAGKRLVRWGSGYGFTPTSLLEPRRDATDPGDRLYRNEGQALLRADVYRGAASLTLAVAAPRWLRAEAPEDPARRLAARVRTSVAGVEISLVAGAAPGEGPSWGANVTHVVGQRLEWHGELLAHDGGTPWSRWADGAPSPRSRDWSAVAGLQYTFPAGVNVVLEYHREGMGMNGASWTRLLEARAGRVAVSGPPPPGRPSRRHFAFARIAPASAERLVHPELIAIAGLDDGGWTLVPSVSLRAEEHVLLYLRGVRLMGPGDSVNSLATTRTSLSAGLALRF